MSEIATPVRGDIHVAVDYQRPDPENMTLREVCEYYKRVVAVSSRVGTPTGLEVKHIDQAWNHLIKLIAEREGVPQGWLAYLLGELARSETRALELSNQTLKQIGDETRDA